jgi:hypothetical protein
VGFVARGRGFAATFFGFAAVFFGFAVDFFVFACGIGRNYTLFLFLVNANLLLFLTITPDKYITLFRPFFRLRIHAMFGQSR